MNPLTDLVPAKYRKYVYAVVAIAAFVYGAYTAANGDWRAMLPALITAALGALAHANTAAQTPTLDEPTVLDEPTEVPGRDELTPLAD